MQLICLGVPDLHNSQNWLKMLALHIDMNVFEIAALLHNILNGREFSIRRWVGKGLGINLGISVTSTGIYRH